MPKGIYSGNAKKEFCARGHSIVLVGRTKTGTCAECNRDQVRCWRKANPKKTRTSTAVWRAKNPNYRAPNRRTSLLKFKFGITAEQWDAMYALQKGCCAICGKHQSEFIKRLSVDHNHQTGKVRGLLCAMCNRYVMVVAETYPHLFQSATEYIKRANG